MKVSYKKLWKLLIDKDMKKADLRRKTGVSSATIAKLTRGDDVKTSVLTRVCEVLACNVGDIMDVVPDDELCTRCVHKPEKALNC